MPPAADPAPPPAACPNCAAPVLGDWCQHCGQHHRPHRTLRAMVGHVLEGVTHADGRLWRTLRRLVFRPGALTRDWIEGRKARHLSPAHLFLFAMFLLFMTMGISDAHLTPLVTDPATMGSEWTWVAEKWTANPALSRYKVDAWAYKLIFLTVPVAAATVALLLARRGHDFHDHAAFALNQIAFLALLATLLLLVPGVDSDLRLNILLAALLVHGIFHLRGAYRLGWGGAIVRGAALAASGALILMLFLYLAAYVAMLV